MAPRGRLHPLRSLPKEPPTPSLEGRALDDLGFIRATMERAAAHTAVPDWGGVWMGLTALIAGPFAIQAPTAGRWFTVWAATAIVAGSIGVWEMFRRARIEGVSLFHGAGSRFAKALAPGLITGMLLTLALRAVGSLELLPGVWLLCYGTAVVGAGAYSIRAVRTMGLSFMLLGGASLIGVVFAPGHRVVGDAFMMAGFGVLHVVFGLVIARERQQHG